jgi:hypothetical protein
MALWQFEVQLIPCQALNREFRYVPARLNEEALSSVDWWAHRIWTSDDETLCRDLLPEQPSWSESVRSWGLEDSDRIDVVIDNGHIVEVSARIDARLKHSGMIEKLVRLAKRWGCVFVTSELSVIPAIGSELKAALMESDAARFVRNPTEFLASE